MMMTTPRVVWLRTKRPKALWTQMSLLWTTYKEDDDDDDEKRRTVFCVFCSPHSYPSSSKACCCLVVTVWCRIGPFRISSPFESERETHIFCACEHLRTRCFDDPVLFCLHLLVHLEFLHLIYWRFIFNVIRVQLNQDFSSLIVTHCIFVQVLLR